MCVIFNELLMLQQLNTSLERSEGYRANYGNVVRRRSWEREAVFVSVLLLGSTMYHKPRTGSTDVSRLLCQMKQSVN